MLIVLDAERGNIDRENDGKIREQMKFCSFKIFLKE